MVHLVVLACVLRRVTTKKSSTFLRKNVHLGWPDFGTVPGIPGQLFTLCAPGEKIENPGYAYEYRWVGKECISPCYNIDRWRRIFVNIFQQFPLARWIFVATSIEIDPLNTCTLTDTVLTILWDHGALWLFLVKQRRIKILLLTY